MKIDRAVRLFANFLNSSWEIANQMFSLNDELLESAIEDWLQSNWELLVEKNVLGTNDHLEVYGDGADYNKTSSRISDIDALPNFRVSLKPKNEEKVFDNLSKELVELKEISFEKIVGFKNGFYVLEPDFKYVLVTENDYMVERVIDLNDVEFTLVKIDIN